MSKKRGIPDAKTTARKFQQILWRYRIRNPDFRKDLKRLQEACNSGPQTVYGTLSGFQHFLTDITEKWDLPFIPATLFLKLPPSEIDRIEYLEDVVSEYGQGPPIAHSPVSLIRLEHGRFIDLRVRCYEHPVNELLLLIEEELNFATRNLSPKRRRLDKVPFQLKVFDQTSRGEDFSKIAKKLNRRPSTVKSAYLTASRHIFGDSKKKAVVSSIDPNSHLATCCTCQKAEKSEEMCPAARRYANQDTKPMRERVGYDTTR